MGACFRKLLGGKRYKDEPLNPKASAVVPACTSPPHNDGGAKARVQLFGDHLCPFTLRVRIALQYKVDLICIHHTKLLSFKKYFMLAIRLSLNGK